jgi:hypothetical protein
MLAGLFSCSLASVRAGIACRAHKNAENREGIRRESARAS